LLGDVGSKAGHERRAVMIQGLITEKDVLQNAALIVEMYGVGLFVRCLWVLARGQRVTFLSLVWGIA